MPKVKPPFFSCQLMLARGAKGWLWSWYREHMPNLQGSEDFQPEVFHLTLVTLLTFQLLRCTVPPPIEVCSSCQSFFVLVGCCTDVLSFAFETHLGVLSFTSMHGSALHVSQSHSSLSKRSNCYRPALTQPLLLLASCLFPSILKVTFSSPSPVLSISIGCLLNLSLSLSLS